MFLSTAFCSGRVHPYENMTFIKLPSLGKSKVIFRGSAKSSFNLHTQFQKLLKTISKTILITCSSGYSPLFLTSSVSIRHYINALLLRELETWNLTCNLCFSSFRVLKFHICFLSLVNLECLLNKSEFSRPHFMWYLYGHLFMNSL